MTASVIERIQLSLELLTARFNRTMTQAVNKLTSMNTVMRTQQNSYRVLNSRIRKLVTSLNLYKKVNTNLRSGQQGYVTKQEKLIAGLKKQRGVVSNSLAQTREQLSLQRDNIAGMRNEFSDRSKASKLGAKQELRIAKATFTNKIANQGFFKTLGMGLPNIKEFHKLGGKMNNRLGALGMSVRMATHGLRGFRMEMLGVMFFGMGMQKFFTGLLRPALEAVGMFELWRTTLELLFLPISMLLFEYLMPLFMWMMNLDDGTKLLIGKLVLFAAGMGAVLFLVGMLALGIGSMILVFSGLFNIIDRIIPDVDVLGVNMSSFVEAGLMIGLVGKAFGVFKKVVSSVLEKILELEFIRDFFDKLGIDIDDNLSAWENLKNALITIWDKIKKKLNIDSESEGISGWITKLQNKFNDWFDDIKDEIKELGLDDMITSFKNLGATFTNIAPSIKTIAESLQSIANAINAVKSAYEDVSDWLLRRGIALPWERGTREEKLERVDVPQENDFIWRPGQSPISVNPKDTLVGFKEPISDIGGEGIIIQENNYYGFTSDDLRRELDDRDRRWVDDLRRLVKT